MAREDTNDFIAAFGIGAVLGIGAALLLRPERPDPRRRLLRKVKPHAKQVRRGAKRIRRAAREEYREAAGLGGDAIEHGRELLHEFRAEVGRILDEARRELHALGGAEGSRTGAVPPAPGGEG